MTLSDFSIKRPVFAWILMFSLLFFGFLSFRKMGVNENPDVDYPTINISYTYEGAPPAVIEKDILEPVESVLVAMQGIRNMNSTAQRGIGNISLEFELEKNIDFALQEVQSLLGRAQRQLPENLEPPVTTKSNASDDPILYLVLTAGNLTNRDLMLLFRDRVRDQLSTIEGVSEIRPAGFHEPMLRVDLVSKKLRKFDLTADDVIASIRREHSELPAGKFEAGDREDLIRIMGEVEKGENFKDIVITRRGGSPNYVPTKLSDIANVYEGLENTKRISRINGKPGLVMIVQKQRGVNAVDTVKRVNARIVEMNAGLPTGTKVEVHFDRTHFVRESIDELLFTLVLSAILTSLVCWLFIGTWSSTLNILLAIPTSVVGTFIFIHWLGFTLNTFTILGLALAIGIIVDDAIVMLENIIRYRQNGYSRVNAAFKGAREISFAVIATTLALVALFLPVAFMPGIEGRFFLEFAFTISIAVALSSLESLTLAPMRCSQFLELGDKKGWMRRKIDSVLLWVNIGYEKTLHWALSYKRTVAIVSILMFVCSLYIFKLLPTEFAPAQDTGALSLNIMAPDGKSMRYTDAKVLEFEKLIENHPDIERTLTAVGGFGAGGQGNRGNGMILLKPLKERKRGQFEIATELRQKAKSVEGIEIQIRDRFGGSIGGRRGSPVEFTINGPDPEMQKELFAKLKEKMDASGKLVDTRSEDVRTLPEVHILPNREKALAHGVEVETISNIVNATFGGIQAVQYTEGSSRFDVFVQLQEKDRQEKSAIESILIRNNRGQTLPLSTVVDVVEASGPQVIYREDRIRGVRVDASLAEGVTGGDAVNMVNQWVKEIFPEKYYIRYSATPQDKLFETLIVILLGLVVAYMLLACQFNSFVDPMLIFLAVPFGLTGSLAALVIGGQTLNVYSAIGLLLTMGIVKKNSILLIEFTNQLRDSGIPTMEALRQACSVRLRPILMTNFATIAAAIPAALALGPGAETRIPMALTIIGGVSVSLLFTMYVVPCFYGWVDPKRRVIFEEEDAPELGKPSHIPQDQSHAGSF